MLFHWPPRRAVTCSGSVQATMAITAHLVSNIKHIGILATKIKKKKQLHNFCYRTYMSLGHVFHAIPSQLALPDVAFMIGAHGETNRKVTNTEYLCQVGATLLSTKSSR